MAGRRDDIHPGHLAGSAARRVEHPAPRGGLRTVGLVAGLLLALAGTAAVFFTDDALYLRVALLATCWAFLVAAFLAAGRRTDQVAAQSREDELRHAYDLELEREVAARQGHELELEKRLRREAEDGMRRELAGLRSDLAGLSGLRNDLTALGELRADLGRLRSELTEQLSGELLIERMVMRAQAVRLPADRSGTDGRTLDGATPADAPRSASWEQHTTVERRPDSSGWALAASTPPVDVFPAPLAALGAPAADRPEPRAARPAAPPPVTSTRRLARVDDDLPAGGPAPAPPSPVEWLSDRSVFDDVLLPVSGVAPALRMVEPAPPVEAAPPVEPDPVVEVPQPVPTPSLPSSPALTVRPPVEPVEPAHADADAPSSVPPLTPGPTTGRPTPAPRSRYRVGLDSLPGATGDAAPPHRHRRAAEPDDHRLPTGSTRVASHGSPAGRDPAVVPAPAQPSWSPDADLAPPAPEPAPVHDPAPPVVPADAHGSGHARLEQILAESGVSPAPGRRRRRYRDEDDPQPPDDVLARVLGRQ
jgi:hypothetical protein